MKGISFPSQMNPLQLTSYFFQQYSSCRVLKHFSNQMVEVLSTPHSIKMVLSTTSNNNDSRASNVYFLIYNNIVSFQVQWLNISKNSKLTVYLFHFSLIVAHFPSIWQFESEPQDEQLISILLALQEIVI